MSDDLPFRTLGPWLAATFGRPVHRVALDAGSTCPNRDGTKGYGGCTYCDIEGSGTGALKSGQSLAEQLDEGLARVARRASGIGALAYFQSYTNTYVDNERFAEVLGIVERRIGVDDGLPPIVAVSVATRPDCLPESALDVLEQLARRVPVWVELGLETASDEVLLAINRLHTLEEFHDATRRARARGLGTVGHAILGLPGDGREGARRTAEALAAAGVDGVKVHHLMVLARTQLAHQWRQGLVETLDAPTYVAWLADFVERLRPEQVLHRITGDARADALLAPHWPVSKNEVRSLLAKELDQRGTRQGTLYDVGTRQGARVPLPGSPELTRGPGQR